MNYARMILKKMFYPPKWVRIIIPMMSFTALIFIFAMGEKESMLAYTIYGMSAYSLSILPFICYSKAEK